MVNHDGEMDILKSFFHYHIPIIHCYMTPKGTYAFTYGEFSPSLLLLRPPPLKGPNPRLQAHILVLRLKSQTRGLNPSLKALCLVFKV